VTRESHDTRERLLEAACELFAAHGFRGASVREICARARANIAAVNYYFHNKEDLYLAALRKAFALVRTEPLRVSGPRDALEALRGWITDLVERVLGAGAPAWSLRLLWRELLDPTEAMTVLVREAIGPDMENVKTLLSHLAPHLDQRQGLLWGFTVIGQVLFYSFARSPVLELMDRDSYGPKDRKMIADHLFRLVTRGLGIRTERRTRKPGRKRTGKTAEREKRK